MPEVLARYDSSSSTAVYEVYRANDGALVCNCQGWRMNKGSPKECRHTKTYQAEHGEKPAVPAAFRQVAAPPPSTRQSTGDRLRAGAPKAMTANDFDKAPFDVWTRDDYIMEPKIDGERKMLRVEGGHPVFYSRSGISYRYPWAEGIVLPEGTLLDGELAPPGERSLYGSGSRDVLEYKIFDVMRAGDIDFSAKPWTVRRRAVEQIVESIGDPRVVTTRVLGRPDRKLYESLLADGYEGVMLKRVGSTYQFGQRSWDWLKAKGTIEVDVVILDMEAEPTSEERKKAGWRGLRYGYSDGKGGFVVAGSVGYTGTPDVLRPMLGRVAVLKAYALSDGVIRHPHFLRLRDDKLPSECLKP